MATTSSLMSSDAVDANSAAPPKGRSSLESWEDMAAAITQLFETPVTEDAEAAFKTFLEFGVRFSNLSLYNAMLVRVQRRGAVAVGTARKWAEIGRRVRPGAAPIVILRPCGPVSLVFELGDTDGKDLPGDWLGTLKVTGNFSREDLVRFEKTHTKRHGIIIMDGQFGSALAGMATRYHCEELPQSASQQGGWLIRLNRTHPAPTQFGTLAHELGHIFCGHCGADPKGRWPDRRNLSLAAREVEAETVASLVCSRRGLQTASAAYLRPYLSKLDFTEISLYAVMLAANRIENGHVSVAG